jgi:hypothetical protein
MTERAELKSVAANSVPVVPPFVLSEQRRRPATVAVALMVKDAGKAELLTLCAAAAAGE